METFNLNIVDSFLNEETDPFLFYPDVYDTCPELTRLHLGHLHIDNFLLRNEKALLKNPFKKCR